MAKLRTTVVIIGVFQLVLGGLFLAAPAFTANMMGLDPAAPDWVNWLFAMMGARFLGYAYGMFAVAREPMAHRTWISTMIVIQAVDWLATVGYLAAGRLTFAQVSTASFMPVLFIAALMWWRPSRIQARDGRA